MSDITDAINYSCKQWAKARMIPFYPEWIKFPITKEEQDSYKTEGLKFNLEVDGKAQYGAYIPEIEQPKQEISKPEIKLITNVAKTQEEADTVLEQFSIKDIEDYLDKVIIGGGPKVLAAVQAIVAQYGSPEVKVKKPVKSVARKAKTAKKAAK